MAAGPGVLDPRMLERRQVRGRWPSRWTACLTRGVTSLAAEAMAYDGVVPETLVMLVEA